jgi:putative endonuclease
MNYTYIVRCADDTLYTGWTNSLSKRLKAHNGGKDGAKYTRFKRPVQLVYFEGFKTKQEAMHREYEIKQMTRARKLELVQLSHCQASSEKASLTFSAGLSGEEK